MNWLRRLFVAGAILGPETEDQKASRLKREKRCKAMSGALSGYQCSLDKGHPLPHKAKYSVTHDSRGREVGSSIVIWPKGETQ